MNNIIAAICLTLAAIFVWLGAAFAQLPQLNYVVQDACLMGIGRSTVNEFTVLEFVPGQHWKGKVIGADGNHAIATCTNGILTWEKINLETEDAVE